MSDIDISSSDSVYVKTKFGVKSLGTGFSSSEEVEEYISDRFEDPGEYEYGVRVQLGSVEVEEDLPEPKEDRFSEETLNRWNSIEERAESDERVESFARVGNGEYTGTMTRYRQQIRYKDNQVDFSITLRNDLFDDVPVSSVSMSVESELEDIFNDIVGEDGLFLGYSSGYASRGRKNPYVRVVGRIHRSTEKDQLIRSLDELDFISGLYWSEDNLMPVRMYHKKSYTRDDTSDIITVFDIQDTADSFEGLSEETQDNINWILSQLEEDYDLESMWVGQVQFKKNFDHTCAGLKYTGGE